MEMQEYSWLLSTILRKGPFKIDMCFEYTEDGEVVLQWCQGTVVKLLRDKEKSNYIIVKDKWNDEVVQSVKKQTMVVKLKEST